MLPLWTALLIAPFALPFVPVDLSNTENPENEFWRDGFGPRGTDGFVYAVVGTGSDVIISGGFHTAGSVAANNVALWDNAKQAWSTLGEGPSNGVSNAALGLARVGDDVFVAGQFGNAGGVPARGIGWWNRASGSWRGLGSGVDGQPYSVAADERDVFVGGDIRNAGGVHTGAVARWDRATETWNALGGVVGFNGSTMDVACTEDFLYVAGYGLIVNEFYWSNLLRWNRNTHVWSQIPGYFSGRTKMDVLPGGKVVLGAVSQVMLWNETDNSLTDLHFPFEFSYGIQAVHAVSEDEIYVQEAHMWRWDGSVWTRLPDIQEVLDIATCQGSIFAGGTFEAVGDTGALNVARFDGNAWRSLGDSDQNGTGGGLTGNDGSVLTLVSNGQQLYAGGDFGVAGEVVARKIAMWDGHSWSRMGGGITDPEGFVWIVAPHGQDVFVGGSFNSVDGTPMHHVARWNNLDKSWHSLGSGVAGNNEAGPYVDGLLIVGSDLYVAGDFTTAGGVTAHSIARWDMDKGTWSALGASPTDGVDGWLGAMVARDDDLFVTGGFFRAGALSSTARHTIAKWSFSNHTWSYLRDGIRDDVDGIPWAILERDSMLYVCGEFRNAGNVPARGLAVFDLVQKTWSPIPGSPIFSSFSSVYSLIFYGGDLVVGGQFNQFPNGDLVSGVAKWNVDKGWRTLGDGVWSAVSYRAAQVFAITAMGPGLYLGGRFDRAGDKVSLNVARWQRSQDFHRVYLEPSGGSQSEFALRQNVPNPASGATRISFETKSAGTVRLRILDLAGREVARPIDAWITNGEHALMWPGTSNSGEHVPPGIYVYRLETPDGVLARKLVMTR